MLNYSITQYVMFYKLTWREMLFLANTSTSEEKKLYLKNFHSINNHYKSPLPENRNTVYENIL